MACKTPNTYENIYVGAGGFPALGLYYHIFQLLHKSVFLLSHMGMLRIVIL